MFKTRRGRLCKMHLSQNVRDRRTMPKNWPRIKSSEDADAKPCAAGRQRRVPRPSSMRCCSSCRRTATTPSPSRAWRAMPASASRNHLPMVGFARRAHPRRLRQARRPTGGPTPDRGSLRRTWRCSSTPGSSGLSRDYGAILRGLMAGRGSRSRVQPDPARGLHLQARRRPPGNPAARSRARRDCARNTDLELMIEMLSDRSGSGCWCNTPDWTPDLPASSSGYPRGLRTETRPLDPASRPFRHSRITDFQIRGAS